MKFPHFLQHDQMDCAPVCLKNIASYYGRFFSLDQLRNKCHTSHIGTSLANLKIGAENMGFEAKPVFINWDSLAKAVPLPCIVHWNDNHYVIVYKIKKRLQKYYIYVSDPAKGLVQYNKEEFVKYWIEQESFSLGNDKEKKGIALILQPTSRFYENGDENEDKTKWGFKNAVNYIKPYYKYLVQLFIGLLVGTGIDIVLPFINQSIVDTGIINSNLSFVNLILVAQFAFVFGRMVNQFIQSWLLLHVSSRVAITLISDFLLKLTRLPIAFFDSRKVGDILQRIQDTQRITSFLTESLLSIIIAVLTTIVYGIIMGGYNVKILEIFAIGTFLYLGWISLFLGYRKKLDYMRFEQASKNSSNLIQMVNGMQDIKLNNCENQKRWKWEKIQVKLFNISFKELRLVQYQQLGSNIIDQTKNILISFFSAKAVIEGDMTLGMMTSIQYILGQLNAPISQFISFIQSTQDAKISLDRIGEIQKIDDEEPENSNLIKVIPEDKDIVFNQVNYQYGGPSSKMVLKNINLKIPSNKVTVIVGPSGSGKTTMLKMMLGFYKPVNGKVLLGDDSISDLSPKAWRAQCGAVMQDGCIFNDSIGGNISMGDVPYDLERVTEAAKLANIDDFIETLPNKYDTQIGAEGVGLSTGQKQRILIARAVYKRCKFLFLDEATSSLDATNERFIMKNLKDIFVQRTVVISAHRLSTVRDADNIIVLNEGVIVEQGKHEDLIKKRGFYFNLIRNQLELGE